MEILSSCLNTCEFVKKIKKQKPKNVKLHDFCNSALPKAKLFYMETVCSKVGYLKYITDENICLLGWCHDCKTWWYVN